MEGEEGKKEEQGVREVYITAKLYLGAGLRLVLFSKSYYKATRDWLGYIR